MKYKKVSIELKLLKSKIIHVLLYNNLLCYDHNSQIILCTMIYDINLLYVILSE